MRISISGHIGSGKTTVANLLGNLSGYKVYSGGYFFRKIAEEKQLTLEQLNLESEKNDDLDFKLNAMIEQFFRDHDNIIVESRLAGCISHQAHIKVFRVLLTASLETRVRRVSGREAGDDILDRVRLREESENRRFKKYFNFDLDDKSIYDTVIDTEQGSAEEIANKIYKLAFSNSG